MTKTKSVFIRKLENFFSEFKPPGFFISVVTFCIICYIIPFVIYNLRFDHEYIESLSLNHEEWGTFGDFVGGLLNPLFALASVLAVLFTIRQQTTQISRSEKSIERQYRIQRLNKVESTIFDFLSHSQREIDRLKMPTNEYDDDGERVYLYGIEVIRRLHSDLISLGNLSFQDKNTEIVNYLTGRRDFIEPTYRITTELFRYLRKEIDRDDSEFEDIGSPIDYLVPISNLLDRNVLRLWFIKQALDQRTSFREIVKLKPEIIDDLEFTPDSIKHEITKRALQK